MKNSTAEKLKQIPEGYLIVGVDPHKKRHAVVTKTQDAVVQSKFKVVNSRRGYEELLERARAQMVTSGCRGLMFAIETASHFWRNLAYFLEERGIPFRLINPFTLKRRREGRDINKEQEQIEKLDSVGETIKDFCSRVEERLSQFNFEEKRLALQALQIRAVVNRDIAKLYGAIPTNAATIGRTWA